MHCRFDLYLDWAWIGLFVAMVIVRKVHESRLDGRAKMSGIPIAELLLMGAWAMLIAVAPFFFIFSDWLAFADYPFRVPPFVGLTGIGLFIVATWLLHASHRDLGTAWTPRSAPAEGETLVTDGIYAKLRHPMYAAHLLWAIAQALILPNFLAGTGAIVPFVFLLWLRIPREERALAKRFGAEYRAYASRTGRFWPKRAIGVSAPRD